MPIVDGKKYPYTPKGKADAKKAAATKYVQPGIDPNTTAANIAAQRNVQPNPLTMKTGPFKMNYNKSSFPFKSSPAKDTPHTTTETHTPHHEMTGTLNKDKTRVVDEEGNWAGVGDRPDLVKKEKK